jgi:hypothetical protein
MRERLIDPPRNRYGSLLGAEAQTGIRIKDPDAPLTVPATLSPWAPSSQPSREEIDELIALLPSFENTDETIAEWSKGSIDWEAKWATLPYPSYSDAITAR